MSSDAKIVQELESAGPCGGNAPRMHSEDEISKVVHAVASNAATWHTISDAKRIELLKEIKARVAEAATLLGTSFAKICGFPGADGSGDATKGKFSGKLYISAIGRHIDSLVAMLRPDATSLPPFNTAFKEDIPQRHTTANGAQVFRTLEPDKAGKQPAVDLYIQPGKPATRGNAYSKARNAAQSGACVVLGAGNAPMLSIIDTLQKMFLGNYPCVLKHHDTMSEASKYIEYMLAPLRDTHCYAGLHCDVPCTTALLQHPAVAAAHMTGSLATHDAIVWGPPHEREARKASNDPLLTVPMTSELGSVTPHLVVPGVWSEAQLERHTAQIKDKFVALLKQKLQEMEPTPAWYPGTQAVYDRFLELHNNVTLLPLKTAAPPTDVRGPPVLPFAMCDVRVEDGNPRRKLPCFTSEFFAPVFVIACISDRADMAANEVGALHKVGVGSNDLASSDESLGAMRKLSRIYLERAVQFVNDVLWGNLCTVVHIDNDTQVQVAAEVQEAVDHLEYGAIVVNAPASLAVMQTMGVWGGFQAPDTSVANARSGVGLMNNMLHYDHAQKSVVWFDWDT